MAGPIRDFRDLGAWQCAMDLAVACGDVAAALPVFEAALADQIRRAANAVHACIAEGNGRQPRSTTSGTSVTPTLH